MKKLFCWGKGPLPRHGAGYKIMALPEANTLLMFGLLVNKASGHRFGLISYYFS